MANTHRFLVKATHGRLTLAYNVDINKWRMSGGRYGEHFISVESDYQYGSYDMNHPRVQAHWNGYIYNNNKN